MDDKITTKFINETSKVSLFHHDANKIVDDLPLGVYSVGFNKFTGFYLNKVFDTFKVPERVYGNITDKAERIFKRYESDNNSLGVLLLGRKGSGKTLLSVIAINKFLTEYKKPVIIVNKNFEDLNTDMIDFISQFKDTLFIFDEYEKIFDRNSQELFLNFFDDKFKNNRLTFVISNSTYLSEFLLDRPSRFFYRFNYDKLDSETVIQVCRDLGLDDIISDLLTIREKSEDFSFDILNAIISEVQLTGDKNVNALVEDMNLTVGGYTLRDSYESEIVEFVCQDKDKEKIMKVKTIEARQDQIVVEYQNGYNDYASLGSRNLVEIKEDIYTYMITLDYDTDPEDDDAEVLHAKFIVSVRVKIKPQTLDFRRNLDAF